MRFNADQRQNMTSLISSGKSCNAIARELGVSPSTVSRHAKAAGLTFDRSLTAKAVEAARIDAASRRAEVGAGLLEDISRARLTRLAEANDARDFQQVAQGVAALSRAYKDLAGLPGPPDGGEEEARASLAEFLSLVKVRAAEQQQVGTSDMSPGLSN